MQKSQLEDLEVYVYGDIHIYFCIFKYWYIINVFYHTILYYTILYYTILDYKLHDFHHICFFS